MRAPPLSGDAFYSAKIWGMGPPPFRPASYALQYVLACFHFTLSETNFVGNMTLFYNMQMYVVANKKLLCTYVSFQLSFFTLLFKIIVIHYLCLE